MALPRYEKLGQSHERISSRILLKIPRKKCLFRLPLFVILATGFYLLFMNYAFPFLQDYFDYSIEVSPLEFNPSSNDTEIWLDFCNLTDVDPWDPSIMEYIKPEKDPMLNCTPTIFQHSKLIDGQLFIYSNGKDFGELDCDMRCLLPKSDWNLKYGSWIKVINGTKPECDVIEVQCQKDGIIYYTFFHAHVYRESPSLPSLSPPPSKPSQKFDVHIIVLDAVAQTQFIRSMPKTIHMLNKYYEAIPFYHLNKIGINSHPNGFAFLIGKMFEYIPKSPFSRGHLGQYPNRKRACRTPLDNEQFIGFRFKDDGYVTMMAEDWMGGVFSFPYCEGFHQTPMDHYMKPFNIRSEELGNNAQYKRGILYTESCHEPHYYICDYLKSFLKAYPDKPKFSISWMISLSHDEQNALSSSDDYFYHFFNDTKKDFENSFIFFMGDHGLRFGKMRETEVGEIEDNNPFLFVSVPKTLRSNLTFMQQLRENSNELITHYDIYATLNDLVQPKNPRIPNPLLLGSSIFQPLPYPRTCDSLRIPFEYCICRSKKTLLPKNNTIGIPAAQLMIEKINSDISNSNDISSLCSKLSLNESADVIVEDYGGEQILRIFKVTFSTIPGNAKFWGVISSDPRKKEGNNIEIISSKFLRLNSYGDQAKCAVKSDLASYCFCIK